MVQRRLTERAFGVADLDEHLVHVQVEPGALVECLTGFAGCSRFPRGPDRVEVDGGKGGRDLMLQEPDSRDPIPDLR
jgi:hypothetical protein